MSYGTEGDVGNLTPKYASISHFNPPTHQGDPRIEKISFKNKIDFF
jgi:hypothetical protein